MPLLAYKYFKVGNGGAGVWYTYPGGPYWRLDALILVMGSHCDSSELFSVTMTMSTRATGNAYLLTHIMACICQDHSDRVHKATIISTSQRRVLSLHIQQNVKFSLQHGYFLLQFEDLQGPISSASFSSRP